MATKKNISKIISSGSIMQRILLYFENNARKSYGLEPILTKAEETAIFNSTKTPAENKKWNDFYDSYALIFGAISNLSLASQKIEKVYSDIRGYILLWYAYDNVEMLANSVLHEIQDPKERKKIAKKAIKWDSLFTLIFTGVSVDQEGYIDTNAPKKKKETEDYKQFRIKELLATLREQAEELIINFLSLRQAIYEYMEEAGVDMKTYKEKIKDCSVPVFDPIIDWYKYRSDKKCFYDGVSALNTRLNKLKAYYSVTPQPENLEPDKELVKVIKKRLFDYGG